MSSLDYRSEDLRLFARLPDSWSLQNYNDKLAYFLYRVIYWYYLCYQKFTFPGPCENSDGTYGGVPARCLALVQENGTT
jgi:hypothetical protein